jgi:hypothetical protein
MATYGNSSLNMGGVQVSTYNQIGNYPVMNKEYLVMQQPLQAAVAGMPQRTVAPGIGSSQGVWSGAHDPQQRVQHVTTYQLGTPMASQPMVVMRNAHVQPQVVQVQRQVQRQVQPQVIRVQQQQPQFMQLQQQPQVVQMQAQPKTSNDIVYLNVNGVLRQGIVQNGSVYLLEPPVQQNGPATSVPSRPAMNGLAQPGARTVIQLAPAQAHAANHHQAVPQSGPMYIQQQPQQVQQPVRYAATASAQVAMKPLAPANTVLQPLQIQQQQVAVQYAASAQPGIVKHQQVILGHPNNQTPGSRVVLTRAQSSQPSTQPAMQPLVITPAPAAGHQAQTTLGSTALAGPAMISGPVANRLLSTAALVRGLAAGEGHAPVSGATAAMAPGAGAARVHQPAAGVSSSLPGTPALAPQQLLQVQAEAQVIPAATTALVPSAAAAPPGGSPGSGAASRVMFNPTAKGNVGVIGDARKSREDGTSGSASGNSTPKAPGSRPPTPQANLMLPAGAALDLAAVSDDTNLQQVWGMLTEEAKRCGISLESLAILGGSPLKNQGGDVGIAASENAGGLGGMLDGPMNGAISSSGDLGFNAFGFSFFGGAADVANVMEGNAMEASAITGSPSAGLAEHKLGNLLQGLDLGSTA